MMIYLEEIIPNEEQTKILYELLTIRKHVISHTDTPSYAEHKAFVRNHPYRAWLLVRDTESCLGSVYVHTDNSIGVNIIEDRVADCLGELIDKLLQSYKPLPAIKSVRNSSFSINVAPTNQALISALDKRRYSLAQLTYTLRSLE